MIAAGKRTQTATIVDWDDARGFGFLATGSGRLFLHCRDLADSVRGPEIGDRVRFEMGQDPHGRSCAIRAVNLSGGRSVLPRRWLGLTSLLILPALALSQCISDWRWGGGYLLGINALAFGAYGWDKRRARLQAWRLSEARLHLFELLGGWPGAFVAQRVFRHKTAKRRFQVVFWAIVITYQLAAADFLFGWPVTLGAITKAQSVLAKSADRR